MPSYNDAVAQLFRLQRHGIKLGLETTEGLLARLGFPERRFVSLHVGGTNGKGATAAMTASVLRAGGYRVGLYTSPHLVEFRERIQVDGVMISEEEVARLVDRIGTAVDPQSTPTFFEFTTVMAFQYFADAGVDVAVCEVGLGGRFDATNVLLPKVSAITTVSLDHEAYLGHTVELIAREKGGIIKPGVPVVTGQMTPEADAVLGAIAAERGAGRYRLGEEFSCHGDPLRGFDYRGLRTEYRALQCPLQGAHQLDNAACALATLELAGERDIPVTDEAVRKGLRRVQWEGRLEQIETNPMVLLDGAHNPGAAEALGRFLAAVRLDRPQARIVLVVAMMRDKDRTTFLHALLPFVDDVILTETQLSRTATVQELQEALGPKAPPSHQRPRLADALGLARRLARSQDIILITGSLMLVGEVKAILRRCELSPLRG